LIVTASPNLQPQRNGAGVVTTMNGKLAQNVRAKFFQDFERCSTEADPAQKGTHSKDVEAMLCGFILEGDELSFAPEQATNVDQDWFYKL